VESGADLALKCGSGAVVGTPVVGTAVVGTAAAPPCAPPIALLVSSVLSVCSFYLANKDSGLLVLTASVELSADKPRVDHTGNVLFKTCCLYFMTYICLLSLNTVYGVKERPITHSTEA